MRVIRRALLVVSFALILPIASTLLTKTDTNKTLLTPYREVSSGETPSFNVSGTSGYLTLRGQFIPIDNRGNHGSGDIMLSLYSSEKARTVRVALHREESIKISLPHIEKPQRIDISYLPVFGPRPDAHLIISDLIISWEGGPEKAPSLLSALRAWTCPIAPLDVIGVVYIAVLIAAVLCSLADTSGMPILTEIGFHRWSCLFIAAILISAFPGRFSPLTRLIVVGHIPLVIPVLTMVGLFTIRSAILFPQHIKYTAILIIFAAGLVRVVAARDMGNKPARDIDEIVYSGMAANIARGKGFIIPDNAYKTENLENIDPVRKLWWKNDLFLGVAKKGQPTAAVPPIYPLFLSVFFQSDTLHYQWIYQVQAILGTISCLILYLVGLRMMNPPTALAGMMLASLHAPFAAVSFYMFTESVFFFFLLLSVLFLSRESYRSLIGAGALLTITALTRSVAVAALPIWLLFAAMKSTGRHRYIAPLIILVSFSCFAVPWAVRNKTKVQHPIIGSSFAGKDLFVGNNDTYRRSFSQPPARAWESLHAIQRFLIRIVGAGPSHVKNMFNFPVKIANEVERDRELRLRSFTFIIAYPRTFIRLVWDRLEAMTGLSGEPRLWDRVGILPVLFLPMLCVIPFGFIGNTGIFRFHIFLLLSAILLAVPPLITVGYPRYRLPSDWFFFLLAGSGIHYVMYTFSSVMGSHYKTAWRKIRPVFGR